MVRTRAFCQLFLEFTAHSVPVDSTKALRWGLGSYVLPAFAVPRTHLAAQVDACFQRVLHQGPAVGPG